MNFDGSSTPIYEGLGPLSLSFTPRSCSPNPNTAVEFIFPLVVAEDRVVGLICVSILIVASVSQISHCRLVIVPRSVGTPSITHHPIFVIAFLGSALPTTIWKIFSLDGDLSHSAQVQRKFVVIICIVVSS